MYTVIIADDEKLICDGIKSVIDSALPELEITQIFQDGDMLYEYLDTREPDILLLDIEMPGKSGLDIAQFIYERHYKSRVIIITAYPDFAYAKKAIDYGVNAFLTKPFTSGQLVDAVRKSISYMNQHSTSADNRTAFRSLLQTLCTSRTDTQVYDEVFLCRGTMPLKKLLCTEVTFMDNGIDILPVDKQASLVETLIGQTENDSIMQSSFFLENNNDRLTFLIFSEKEPDLSFTSEVSRIIGRYTGNVPKHTIRVYPSLFTYRTRVSYAKTMDKFFSTLAADGSNQARKQLVDYILSLPEHQRQCFADFLYEQYQITIDQTDAETIRRSLGNLISNALGTHSNNYIVDSAKDYISKNFSSDSLSLESTADALSVSSYYLSRIFKKVTNQNFSEYLLTFRMDHAQKLLKTTHLSTIEIAKEVGYCNPAYFRTSFKAYFGMPPRQFRLLQTREES
ncbi:MAG: response regulator [Lachnospiraceae bacterium]|nr:response regulator [Lachnospiraceae bacterium]MBQ8230501.1 response regulator [Lachnospiraceae bacterium]